MDVRFQPGGIKRVSLIDVIDQFWTINAQIFVPGGSEIPVDKFCNGFIAINTGDTLVTVNGFPLKPFPPGHPELTGASISVVGNRGEIYKGRIYIQYPAVLGADPQVLIAQKLYINE